MAGETRKADHFAFTRHEFGTTDLALGPGADTNRSRGPRDVTAAAELLAGVGVDGAHGCDQLVAIEALRPVATTFPVAHDHDPVATSDFTKNMRDEDAARALPTARRMKASNCWVA